MFQAIGLTELSYDTPTQTVTIVFDGALTTAHVVDSNWAIVAKGHALQNPADPYDGEVGAQLALARAQQRLARKVERAIIKSTK